uniref:Uncharacterized protein n=1 Tax=Salix viminalis TaxID=40686 RepID=A0A6N2NJK5_SALVM
MHNPADGRIGVERIKDGIKNISLNSKCTPQFSNNHLLPKTHLSIQGSYAPQGPGKNRSDSSSDSNCIGKGSMFATPDQRSVEEAESGARDYAQSLLQLKDLLESQSWKEAQKVLRRRSSNLKLDLYAVIESKPGKDRPQLRTLYSNLFNNVTKLDYAVRDRDVSIVWQCYENIVATYDLILSRI